MEKSNETKNLFSALLKFNAEMGKISKTSSNPFFKSKYAALPDILDAISEPLHNSGLVIIQIPDNDGLTCIVAHAESGEYISANGIMKPIKNDPQSIGSAITYQRRYSIASILNLNIDEDDDGNKASGKTEKPFDNSTELVNAIKEINDCKGLEELQAVWIKYKSLQTAEIFVKAKEAKKAKFIGGK